MVPEYCSHNFFVRQCLFEFLGLVGGMLVHPLFRLLFGLCIHELYPGLVTSHDSIKKFVPPLPSSAEETSRLTLFFEFCENQSVVFLVPTLHRTYGNPICP